MSNTLKPDWFDQWFENTFKKDVFSPLELSSLLSRSKDVIYRALASAELEGIKIGKRSYVIPKHAIKKWLIEQNVLNVE